MLARLTRVFKSLFGAAGMATTPVKTITGIVISMLIPYLLYAFLGGFGIALLIVGGGWLVWYLAKKSR